MANLYKRKNWHSDCYHKCGDSSSLAKDDSLTTSLSSASITPFQVKEQDVDTSCVDHFRNSSEQHREWLPLHS